MTSEAVHNIKFRAECLVDLDNLQKHLATAVEAGRIGLIQQISVVGEWGSADIEVVFATTDPSGALTYIRSLRDTDDLHVIAETVEIEDDYSGERVQR